jgi:pimeloyl-ACP methyl ester carboxylesterase
MRKLAMIGVFALLGFGFWALPCAAQQSIDGDWIGGIDFGREWQPVRFSFKSEGATIKGTLDFPQQNRIGLALNRVVFESPHVHIEWQGRTAVAAFDGVLEGESISGEFVQGERKGKFGLVRVAKANPGLNEEYSGSYQLSPDRIIDMGPIGDHIRFVDSKTRQTRYLYPSSETSFFSGPSIGIPFPVELRVTFLKNKQGKVSGLLWKENGGRPLKAKRLPYKEEEVTYQYGDATVTAKLLIPATQGLHPALINIGQGYFLGPDNGPDQYFYVRQGLAMMTPIRRTIGGSEANYLKSSFEERAREVLAGVEMLKQRKDINPRRIGLYGDSQTAWIAPLAATLSPDVGFLILRVPSALPVTENILYEIESNLRRDNFSQADITKALALRQLIHRTILTNTGWEDLKAEIEKSKNEKWFPYVRAGWFPSLKIPPDEATAKGLRDPLTYDPLPVLQTVTVPVLALNGELDEAVPTKQSVPILEGAFRKAGNKDFTIIVLPKAGHNFLETDRPYGAEEFVRKTRYVSGYWDTLAAWLRKHVKVKK